MDFLLVDEKSRWKLAGSQQGGWLEATKLVSRRRMTNAGEGPKARPNAPLPLHSSVWCSLILVAAEQHTPPIASCSRTQFAYRAWEYPHARPTPRPRLPTLPAPLAGPLRDLAACVRTSLQGVTTESKSSLSPGMKAICWFCALCNASPQGPWQFPSGLVRSPARKFLVPPEDRGQ